MVNFPHNKKIKTAREAAYLAVCSSLKGESYVVDFLEKWKDSDRPVQADFNLAYEITAGAIRMSQALDFLAGQLTDKNHLSLKVKEKALLRTALYQAHYMNRLPLYAINNESQNIAKSYCHETFAKFLNALLHKYAIAKPSLPMDNLAIYYSYPDWFVNRLSQKLDLNTVRTILAAGNVPPSVSARKRPSMEMIEVHSPSELQEIAKSKEYYIQNETPVKLMAHLAAGLQQPPQSILDLCAAPGGKTILAHDLFPQATLFANDPSEARNRILQENLKKYEIHATVSAYKGELFPTDKKFDLVIIDAPCSNSGVLNKRAEARWRLTPENVAALEAMQQALVARAKQLLTENGVIWYLTCSILDEELPPHETPPYIIYPNGKAQDGGSAISIS